MNRRRLKTLACLITVALGMPVSCATNKPEMAWVRTDGKRIGNDPDLLKQGQTDIAVCNANLDAGAIDQGGRDCMAKIGYALVRKDQAEQARAGYEASAPSLLRYLPRLIGKVVPGRTPSNYQSRSAWTRLPSPTFSSPSNCSTVLATTLRGWSASSWLFN